MALQLHPDKNGAPGADEAFKSMQSYGLSDFSGITRIPSSFGSRQEGRF